MTELISLEEGTELMKIARKTIKDFLEKSKFEKVKTNNKNFLEKKGCFVSLHSWPRHALRGCIGFPEPVMPLIQAVQESAIDAATSDPRFNAIALNELENIVIEVSVLTKPVEFKCNKEDLIEKIKIGKHGLIVEGKIHCKPKRVFDKELEIIDEKEITKYYDDETSFFEGRGLLLPQVPVEWRWNSKEFLEQTCLKAGLPANAWKSNQVKIFYFEARIFSEEKPNGKVIEKMN